MTTAAEQRSALPSTQRVVVIGAGIVGNSVAYHLCRLGRAGVTLLDKGPLPNPGGSTGHASNFIFPVDHSKEMTLLTLESMRQYRDLDVFIESGGIEIARTEERMQELTRRMASARTWGIEPVSLLNPEQVRELVPFIDQRLILGGFYTPGAGVVDSLRAATMMREEAAHDGLTVAANTEVVGIDLEGGRVRRVRTTRGDIETEQVVIACGAWSPRLAQMAGASIPLTPMVHQMIDIGPAPRFADAKGMIEYPIVRDMDTNMYERQEGTNLEIGSYAHRPIMLDSDEIPSIEEAALTPTELPFTQEDFDPQMEIALELIPEIVGDETVGVKYAINGVLSVTYDGMPLIGEAPEVPGLWSATAIWIKEGPGAGKTIAELMVHGESEIDAYESNIARAYPCQRTRAHIRARASEGFNKMYGIVHPSEQWESDRRVRLPPFYERERGLGAVFFEAAGWERPHWFQSKRAAARGVRRSRLASRGGMGIAVVVADHQRRTPRDARSRGHDRPDRVCDLRRLGPACARRRSARGDAADGRRRGPSRLHAAADAERGLQAGPHDHAPGGGPVSSRDRGRLWHVGSQMVQGPPPRRRIGPRARPDQRLVHARIVGPAGARHSLERHRRRCLARGAALCPLPHDRGRLA